MDIDPTHLHMHILTNQIIVAMQGHSQDFIWSRLLINILIKTVHKIQLTGNTVICQYYCRDESYKAQITPNFEIIVLMYLHVFSKQL
jgi:hypothetical protein